MAVVNDVANALAFQNMKGRPADNHELNLGYDGPVYHYGYPGYGAYEPDVLFQFLMNESGGDIVDVVAAMTLSPTGGVLYGQSAGDGLYSGISPGVSYPLNLDRHSSTSVSGFDIVTSDFTVEAWFSTLNTTASNMMIFRCVSTAVQNPPFGSEYYINLRPSLNICQVYFFAGNVRVANLTMNATDYADGVPHKLRVTNDRSGDLEVELDGASYGLSDISPMDGFDLDLATVFVGGSDTTATNFDGPIYELRCSKNLTNNSTQVFY